VSHPCRHAEGKYYRQRTESHKAGYNSSQKPGEHGTYLLLPTGKNNRTGEKAPLVNRTKRRTTYNSRLLVLAKEKKRSRQQSIVKERRGENQDPRRGGKTPVMEYYPPSKGLRSKNNGGKIRSHKDATGSHPKKPSNKQTPKTPPPPHPKKKKPKKTKNPKNPPKNTFTSQSSLPKDMGKIVGGGGGKLDDLEAIVPV